MPFRFTFRIDDEAMTVPYAPITDDIRRNRGFTDLRGQPSRAKEIAEGNSSSALSDLLVRVAEVGSPIFTLGCDLGSHTEPTHVPKRRREVAGGYVQIASIQYHRTKTEAYAAFANSMVDALRARCGKDNWKIDIVGKGVNFQFDREPKGVQPSLWIWFFAAASDPFAAIESRERLIAALCEIFVLPSALEPFMPSGGDTDN
ncbi:MAG: hypothetical protein HY269_04390 [Deltaproteobacteria bacterium]|nr:hypothetical protein [Deltaproteobacteria bacterium]